MNKKVLSFALSAVLALSAPITVFAEGDPSANSPSESRNPSPAPTATTTTETKDVVSNDYAPADSAITTGQSWLSVVNWDGAEALSDPLISVFATAERSDAAGVAASILGNAAGAYTEIGTFEVKPNAAALQVIAANGGAVDITIKDPSVKATDGIVVIHWKADGSVETLPVVNVFDGGVTFRQSSFSQVLILRRPNGAAANVTAGARKAVPNTADAE